jgi:hypothetical protein
MKTIFFTLIALLPGASMLYAQTDSTQNRRSSTDENTRANVSQTVEKASEAVDEQINKSISYQRANALTWFDEGSMVAGASLGFGLGANSGLYMSLNPRVAYFFQPGFMAGAKYTWDSRLSTSFRSQEFGLFARYYPFRTRINGFGGVGYNFGREFASNVSDDVKARYNSITLEAGVGVWVRRNIGAELSLETNYYDRSNALAGRNRGGRIRFGVNYYFGRANK